MDFKVRVPDEEHFFHGESEYRVDGGVLTVRSDDGTTTVFGIGHWQKVEHDTPRGATPLDR